MGNGQCETQCPIAYRPETRVHYDSQVGHSTVTIPPSALSGNTGLSCPLRFVMFLRVPKCKHALTSYYTEPTQYTLMKLDT